MPRTHLAATAPRPAFAPDVIVLGLGAVGAATTLQLARRGARVLGIDRFSPPHTFGSSHGETRITRQAIGEDAAYVPLVLRAHEIWRELEALTGRTLFRPCGFMAIDTSGGQGEVHGKAGFVARTLAAAESFGIRHERLSAEEARRRYPAFLIPEGATVYVEPGGGIVHPEACIKVQLAEAQTLGAELRLNTPIRAVWRSGSGDGRAGRGGIEVETTSGERISAGQVVVAAGAWTPGLAAANWTPGRASVSAPAVARLRVLRQVLHWFEPTRPAWTGPEAFLPFIWSHGPNSEDSFYGFPHLPGGTPGVKLATEQFSTALDHPEAMDRGVPASEGSTLFETHVTGRIQGISPFVLRAETCLYTQAPDGDFVLGPDPEDPRIFWASACSGHGFKHSPAVGELVAQVLLEGRTIPPFLSSDRPLI